MKKIQTAFLKIMFANSSAACQCNHARLFAKFTHTNIV